MRIGYAGQNGREYVAIGRLLRERGILLPPVTMQRSAPGSPPIPRPGAR